MKKIKQTNKENIGVIDTSMPGFQYHDAMWFDHQKHISYLAMAIKINQLYKSVKKILELGCGARSKIYKMTTTEAINNFEDNSLDFIYIDGDHSYENVKNDLRLTYPKLKKGGLFSGHDYDNRLPDVINAVNEFCSEHNITLQITELHDYSMEGLYSFGDNDDRLILGEQGDAKSWYWFKP